MTDRTDLPERTMKFAMLELPGKSQGTHMGTSYLVDDLWRTLKELPDLIDKLKTCSHEYDEDIGDFIRRYIGLEEKH